MAPCHVEASTDPGLQTLPRQAPLQVGKVAQKVQHPARTHRGKLLAPCQGLEPFRHRDERQRTPDETEKHPGVGSNRCEQLVQDSFNFGETFNAELVHQGGIALEIVEPHLWCLRQAVLGKGPGWSMVNLWCAVEMHPTQRQERLPIRHPSTGKVGPELPPTGCSR